jgi:enamine deaminase RidA (YjgF/YER057c/UK114 family)
MISRHVRTPILHRAVAHAGVIHLAGMVADDKNLPVRGQTEQILRKLDALLKQHGSDASQMLSATIYLTDMSQKDDMNAAWTAFFKPEDLPARATIGVAELGPGTLIEVVATAAVIPGPEVRTAKRPPPAD